jgi:hypothetical protein
VRVPNRPRQRLLCPQLRNWLPQSPSRSSRHLHRPHRQPWLPHPNRWSKKPRRMMMANPKSVAGGRWAADARKDLTGGRIGQPARPLRFGQDRRIKKVVTGPAVVQFSRPCPASAQKCGRSIWAIGSVAVTRSTAPGAMAISRLRARKTGRGQSNPRQSRSSSQVMNAR